MKIPINKQLLEKATGQSVWDKGNKVLYDLCKKHPDHFEVETILAKVWLIGRSYAASIERRKNKEPDEDFYIDVVAPKIQESKIDQWLFEIKGYAKPSKKNHSHLIDVHKRLTDLFNSISGMEKRSLASKYLHFHFPNLFFIYDSRAVKGVKKFLFVSKTDLSHLKFYDDKYASFFLKCMMLTDYIKEKYNYPMNPRKLDNLLLMVAKSNHITESKR